MLNHILSKQIEDDKIFHSYIFEADKEDAKQAYIDFASKLYGFDKGVENLIETIVAENDTISIEKIRELNRSVFNKPAKHKYKIYVIKEAHFMRAEAQNALLKTLEELPEYSIVIMTTDNKYRLLDTIISRSQAISINSKYELNLSSELTEKILYLLKKAFENRYYIASKEKNIIKELSENKHETLHILSKVFSDALVGETTDDVQYRLILEKISSLPIRKVEEIILKIEEIKSLLAIRINFQLAIEDLIFYLISANKNNKKES